MQGTRAGYWHQVGHWTSTAVATASSSRICRLLAREKVTAVAEYVTPPALRLGWRVVSEKTVRRGREQEGWEVQAKGGRKTCARSFIRRSACFHSRVNHRAMAFLYLMCASPSAPSEKRRLKACRESANPGQLGPKVIAFVSMVKVQCRRLVLPFCSQWWCGRIPVCLV